MNFISRSFALLLLAAPLALRAQFVSFTASGETPQVAEAYVSNLDCETTQTVDILLRKNLAYSLDSVVVRSLSVDTLTDGAEIAITEVTPAGVLVQTLLASQELPDSDATGAVHELTPVTEALSVPASVFIENPAAASTSGAFTQVSVPTSATISNGSITDPVWPRNVVIVTNDAAGENLTGTVTVAGTDFVGNSVSEVITVVAGTDSVVGSAVFKDVTSVVYNLNGATSDTLNMGYGAKLGLPFNSRTQSTLAVHRLSVAATAEAATVDSTYGSFIPTTASNGTVDYVVVYSTAGKAKPAILSGGNMIRISITGSTATTDLKNVLVRLSVL